MTTTPGTRRRAVARRGRGAVATVAVLAVALTGCGRGTDDAAELDEVPVAEARPVPFEDAGLAPPSPSTPAEAEDAAATAPVEEESPAPEASPSPSPATAVGPTSADAAAFVASEALGDLAGLEHVVVDLDGDTWPEVVATGIRDRAGVVRVAWWTSDGFEVLAEGVGGPGRDVTDLRAADVNDDGRTELLVAVEGEGLASLAVWTVPRRGVVTPLVAVGGCHDGAHVYGVTRARLVEQVGGPPAIVADCDDSPLPVADWAEQRWTWDGTAYRVVEQPQPPAPDDDDASGDDDEQDGGDGDGEDGDDD